MVEKKRIGGRKFAQHIGEQVIVLGTLVKKSSNGRSIELKTTDGLSVNVALSEPLDGNVNGYIEVHGTIQSKSTMSCSSFIQFPESMTENFDPDQYNSCVSILNILGEKKWRISD